MEFIEGNRVKVDPPKKPKKLTATRFATIFGLNAWSTPFSAWCEMTRTYEEPFTDSVYTVAGKIIEPKIAEYLKDRYFMEIQSPTDVYGADYFKKTRGDFFPGVEALGGMWDFLGDDFVVEVKTTKRAEDWRDFNGNPEPPIYYKLQAALYAYLLGFDNVVMTCSFLEPSDYPVDLGDGKFDESPTRAFEPNVNNTIIVEFKVSEAFPTFKQTYIDPALDFWRDYVLTGISPEYDEKKDAEILKALRKNTVETTDADLSKLMAEADRLRATIEKADAKIADKKKRLGEIEKTVKAVMQKQFRAGDTHVEMKGRSYVWDLGLSSKSGFDSAAFKKDNPALYKKYETSKPVYTLRTKLIES